MQTKEARAKSFLYIRPPGAISSPTSGGDRIDTLFLRTLAAAFLFQQSFQQFRSSARFMKSQICVERKFKFCARNKSCALWAQFKWFSAAVREGALPPRFNKLEIACPHLINQRSTASALFAPRLAKLFSLSNGWTLFAPAFMARRTAPAKGKVYASRQ